ncbi:MAG: hypothetical protein ACTJLM_03725 [Ehrlichia sp.]
MVKKEPHYENVLHVDRESAQHSALGLVGAFGTVDGRSSTSGVGAKHTAHSNVKPVAVDASGDLRSEHTVNLKLKQSLTAVNYGASTSSACREEASQEQYVTPGVCGAADSMGTDLRKGCDKAGDRPSSGDAYQEPVSLSEGNRRCFAITKSVYGDIRNMPTSRVRRSVSMNGIWPSSAVCWVEEDPSGDESCNSGKSHIQSIKKFCI